MQSPMTVESQSKIELVTIRLEELSRVGPYVKNVPFLFDVIAEGVPQLANNLIFHSPSPSRRWRGRRPVTRAVNLDDIVPRRRRNRQHAASRGYKDGQLKSKG